VRDWWVGENGSDVRDATITVRLSYTEKEWLEALGKALEASPSEVFRLLLNLAANPDKLSNAVLYNLKHVFNVISKGVVVFNQTLHEQIANLHDLKKDLAAMVQMSRKFQGVIVDPQKGEKEYQIFESQQVDGTYQYTLICPFSNTATFVNSLGKLDSLVCAECSRTFAIGSIEPLKTKADEEDGDQIEYVNFFQTELLRQMRTLTALRAKIQKPPVRNTKSKKAKN